jgi:hypothetical protein
MAGEAVFDVLLALAVLHIWSQRGAKSGRDSKRNLVKGAG